MDSKTKKILTEIKAYVIITLGLLCYTVGWVTFLIPNHLVGGGVSGISAVINYATGFPISYSFFLINVILLLIALKILGKGFGVKTVYAIIIASVFYRVLPGMISQDFIQEIAISNGKLLCTILGGAFSGLGIGLTFTQGGSTGGTDIVALIINKYRTVSPGKVILLIDVFIIASSLLVPTDDGFGTRLATIMYGYILVAVCGYTVDLYLNGAKQSVQIFIFSKQYDEIAERISKDMHRGVTVMSGIGWFSKAEGKILLVIVKKTEQNILFKIIKEIDNDAFMSVGSVMGVYGKGFDAIKK